MPLSQEELRLVNINAINNLRHIEKERKKLIERGINISFDDWQSAKIHFRNYKLQALEIAYNHYFSEKEK